MKVIDFHERLKPFFTAMVGEYHGQDRVMRFFRECINIDGEALGELLRYAPTYRTSPLILYRST